MKRTLLSKTNSSNTMSSKNLNGLAGLVLVVAMALGGCGNFQIHERICSSGEEPIWYFNDTTAAQCLPNDQRVPEGAARYPRGRVPVWINPPITYRHRTDTGDDAYAVNPNDPNYPWFAEVLAEHPELACRRSDPVRRVLPLVGPQSSAGADPAIGSRVSLEVRVNSVGNRCLWFTGPDYTAPPSGLHDALIRVRAHGGLEWTSRSVRAGLRVGTGGCLRIDARIADADGLGYGLRGARIGTCG